MEQIVSWLDAVVWSNVLVVLIVGAGIFFSIYLKFPQIRHFPTMFKEMRESKADESGTSSLQALLLSLSARLGTGNIAGVATAVGLGGPGALVWMWIVAILGMSTAFCEGVLAQIYKEKHGDEMRGGPAFYLSKGTKWPAHGVIYAVIITLAYSIFLPGTQSNAIAVTVSESWNIQPGWTMAVVAILLFFIAIGGVKRFAKFSQAAVPFAAGIYILLAIIVLAVNAEHIPAMFGIIFSSAFGTNAVFGGLLGSAVIWGVKRGLHSNEAGQGTAAHASATANVKHPVSQGLVQSFGVFFDTIIICTITGLLILVTNSYNVITESGETYVEYLPGVEHGAAYTQAAVDSLVPGLGGTIMTIIVFFFAFTTLQYYQFASEVNLKHLLPGRKWAVWVLRFVIIAAAIYGGLAAADLVWSIGDIGIGIMTWCNIIGLLILAPKVSKALKDYDRQRRDGLSPEFDPEAVGIDNADFWVKSKS